jgi:hypothetical protein
MVFLPSVAPLINYTDFFLFFAAFQGGNEAPPSRARGGAKLSPGRNEVARPRAENGGRGPFEVDFAGYSRHAARAGFEICSDRDDVGERIPAETAGPTVTRLNFRLVGPRVITKETLRAGSPSCDSKHRCDSKHYGIE